MVSRKGWPLHRRRHSAHCRDHGADAEMFDISNSRQAATFADVTGSARN